MEYEAKHGVWSVLIAVSFVESMVLASVCGMCWYAFGAACAGFVSAVMCVVNVREWVQS